MKYDLASMLREIEEERRQQKRKAPQQRLSQEQIRDMLRRRQAEGAAGRAGETEGGRREAPP